MNIDLVLAGQALWLIWIVVGIVCLARLARSRLADPSIAIWFGSLVVIALPPFGLLLLVALWVKPRLNEATQ